MADKSTYMANFAEIEKTLNASGPGWLHDVRRTALKRFEELGFPGTKDEDWRFTRVRPLLQHDFERTESYSPNGLSVADIRQLSFLDDDMHRMVFVNGHYAADLSETGALEGGAWVGTLADALKSHEKIVKEHIGQHADAAANPFVALNTANIMDGAFIYVPTGTVIDKPIHLVFVSRGEAVVSHPRLLIVAEENSQATIIESYVSPDSSVYFTNGVTEIVIDDNANIDHYKLQRESRDAYHVATLQAKLGRSSRMHTDSISLGGTLVRNDVGTTLGGEGIDCTLNGLYMAEGSQHVDNHTNIEHAMPHCDSHELYKGILNDKATAVFNGRIHVHPDAQKTDAKQSNRCVLLSDDAQINTNPQLEIYADDVKCTHGAAVGQIDDKAVFYLRSRGIPAEQARHLLIYAFANDILEKIKVQPLRARLASDLFVWLEGAAGNASA